MAVPGSRTLQKAGNGLSIRRQLLLSTVLTQCLLVATMVVVTILWLFHDQSERRVPALQQQANVLAESSSFELAAHNMAGLQRIIATVSHSRTLAGAEIIDLSGRTIVSTDPTESGLNTLGDLVPKILADPSTPRVIGKGRDIVAVSPITVNGKIAAIVVLEPSWNNSQEQLRQTARIMVSYGVLAILVTALAAVLIARAVTGPLKRLLTGTQRVADGADISEVFPMDPQASNEVGRLIETFNTVAALLERQRSGLNDTLSLLDSMLTNAPIGFAFFDRKCRFVRLNQNIADIHGAPISRHLGQPLHQMMLPGFGALAEEKVLQVFETGETLRDIDLTAPDAADRTRSWVANFFPVRIADGMVRWVGLVMVEVTERRRTEDTLRRTEKLAAAGRLAASIAHEINNPLEGVTNLLYLLQMQQLDEDSRNYITMAQHEVARVSEITQQTLRFYRASTAPAATNLAEIFDSVITLYHGRIVSTQVTPKRRFRQPAEIFGYSGELRQLIANLIGNALDACNTGGTLYVRTAAATNWNSGERGVRITVADTGCGMDEATRARIFEPFFTTKEATGTGLGLWVSAEILGKHHASMRLRSRPGAGTVFYIFFPADGSRATGTAPQSETFPAEITL